MGVFLLVWTAVSARFESTTAIDANGGVFEQDGQTTYCWGVSTGVHDTELTGQEVFIEGINSQCPLQLHLTISAPSSREDYNSVNGTSTRNISATWTATKHETSDAIFNASIENSSVGIAESALYTSLFVCDADAPCQPLLAGGLENAGDATTEQVAQVGLSNGQDVTFEADIGLKSPRNYSLMARVVLSAIANVTQRFDFVVYATLVLEADYDNEEAVQTPLLSLSNEAQGISRRLVIVFVVLGAVVMVMVAVVVTLIVRRRRKRHESALPAQLKSSQHSTSRSPKAGDSPLRRSNWTELYATHDDLPASILQDDSNTIDILRASHASLQSPQRQIADFTREVALWDMHSSASPITPLSGMFGRTGGGDSFSTFSSPRDSFVAMGSLGRTPGTTLDVFADSGDEQEVDV